MECSAGLLLASKMKILFSFESGKMPIRSTTLINWLISRGHDLSILYEPSIGNEEIVYENHINVKIYNHSNIQNSRICKIHPNDVINDFNEYDIWFADVLHYKNYGELSYYHNAFKSYKNKLVIISFDDGANFFEHRLDEELHERVDCWINNLIEKDREVYHKSIQNKCMLMPTYIEDSNKNYEEFKHCIKKFSDKESKVYFSGTITGCLPAIDCRYTSVYKLYASDIPNHVRVIGVEKNPILEHLYTYYLPDQVKSVMVDRPTFLNEINNCKYILSPKGNCQPLRRQYESFAFNNLVFINENNSVDYLYEGTPNVHFVSYKIDCSDLKEKLRYYINNPSEALKIADAGTKFWEDNCRVYNDGTISKNLENTLIDNFKNITGVSL